MKLKIIGDKKNNIVNINREIEEVRKVYDSKTISNDKNFLQNALWSAIRSRRVNYHCIDEDDDDDEDDWDDDLGDSNDNSKDVKKEDVQIEKKEETQN